MKASDLREKSVEDLRELQKTLARDVFQNRLKNFTNRLDDTSSVRKSRKDLARVMTVLKERAMGIVRAGTPAGETKAAEEPKPAKKKAAPKAEAEAAPAAEAKPKKTPAAKKSSAKKSEAK